MPWKFSKIKQAGNNSTVPLGTSKNWFEIPGVHDIRKLQWCTDTSPLRGTQPKFGVTGSSTQGRSEGGPGVPVTPLQYSVAKTPWRKCLTQCDPPPPPLWKSWLRPWFNIYTVYRFERTGIYTTQVKERCWWWHQFPLIGWKEVLPMSRPRSQHNDRGRGLDLKSSALTVLILTTQLHCKLTSFKP